MWYVCFSFSFWQKGEDGGIDAEKTGHCIKSPSAMYLVEVLPLHQERKFLHYCWAARRRTFTKNLLFSAALLYLDTGGQCSHSRHHQAWQVTRVLPTAISDSVLSCQWGFSFSVVCFCVCSLVCVCVHLTSQLAQIGIGLTLDHLALQWGMPGSLWVFPLSPRCQQAHAELDFECCTSIHSNAAGPTPLYL